MVLHGRVLVAPEFLVLVGAPERAREVLQASNLGDEAQGGCVTSYEDNTGGRRYIGRVSASTRGCLIAVNGRALVAHPYRVIGGPGAATRQLAAAPAGARSEADRLDLARSSIWEDARLGADRFPNRP